MATFRYDSWQKFLDHVVPDKGTTWNSPVPSQEWDYLEGWSGAVRLASTGWPDGTARALKLTAPLVDKLGAFLRTEEWLYDVEGAGIDVGRFCEGVPECWQTPDVRTVEGPGRLIRLVLHAWISAGVPARTIEGRGAAVLAFVMLAEQAGFQVAIEWVKAVRDKTGQAPSLTVAVPLKAWGDPVDADRLAFAIAHPACYRRLMFRAMELSPFAAGMNARPGGGYGGGGVFHPEDTGDIYLGPMMSGDQDWSNPDRAAEWVMDELRKIGAVKPD